MDSRLSRVFDVLRFPLSLLVVYLHIAPVILPWDMPEVYFSFGHMVYSNLNMAVCSLAQCAVPCFFFMSAYLLVVNIDELTFKVYKKKILRRIETLFIPYVAWNLLAVGYFYLLGETRGEISFYEIFIAPADFPLWFLRNLIVLVVAFPVFYWIIKSGGEIVSLLIILIYSIWPMMFPLYSGPVAYFTLLSVFYFSLGMYCGVSRFNLKQIPKPIKLSIIILAAISLVMRMLAPSALGMAINNISLVLCVATVFILTDYIVGRFRIAAIPLLSASSFFVYASHKIGATYLSKFPFSYLSDDTYGSQIAVFLISPLLTCVICILGYILVKNIFPKYSSILTGGR